VQTELPRRYKIQVCDFNPYAAVDEVQAQMPAKPAVSVQKYIHAQQDNVFKNTLLFEDSLYGFLPYLEVTTRSTFEMDEVMIDADNIYLVHVSRQPFRIGCLRDMPLTSLL
jgi:lipopolysaccharide assembly outer membrane protein LptD (OstA)